MTQTQIDNSWLQSLKQGDEVAVRNDNYHYIRKVERVTPQFLVVQGNRYRLKDGTQTGDGWHTRRLVPVTDEIRNEVRHRILVERMHCWSWENFPLDLLQAIYSLVREYEQKR